MFYPMKDAASIFQEAYPMPGLLGLHLTPGTFHMDWQSCAPGEWAGPGSGTAALVEKQIRKRPSKTIRHYLINEFKRD